MANQPGLIQNSMSTGYIPKEYELDPNKDLVEGRIQNIIKSDNPLMQMAETTARQNMNSRGLLNSSMAIGEGQKAVYSAALPIASQDANTSVNVGLKNVDTVNRAREFGATAENQFGMQKMVGDQRMGEIRLGGDIDIEKMNIDAGLKKDIMGYEADLKRRGAQDDNAAKYYGQYMVGVSEILKMENVAPDKKRELIKVLGDTAVNGFNLTTAMGGLDLTQYISVFKETSDTATSAIPAMSEKPKYDPGRYRKMTSPGTRIGPGTYAGRRAYWYDTQTGAEYSFDQMKAMFPDFNG